jgi:hypothetical protein
MSLTYTIVPRAASATFASPWNDIPLHRLLLAIRLDGELPETADWSTLPGSPEGVRLYRDFAGLLSRWADATRLPQTAVDRAIDCELAKIVRSDAEVGESITREDVISMLESLVARVNAKRDGFRTELSLAFALLALCHSLADDAEIIRVTTVVPRTYEGPIDYYTAALEGFDSIAAVRVLDDGHSVWCRFASGYSYRIPLDYLREWLPINGEQTIAASRRLSGGTGIRLRLQSGRTVSLSANTILRYCEPQYTDGSPRTAWEQQLLEHAIATRGSFRSPI